MTRPTKPAGGGGGGLRLRGAGVPGQGGVRRSGRELQVQLGSGRVLGLFLDRFTETENASNAIG